LAGLPCGHERTGNNWCIWIGRTGWSLIFKTAILLGSSKSTFGSKHLKDSRYVKNRNTNWEQEADWKKRFPKLGEVFIRIISKIFVGIYCLSAKKNLKSLRWFVKKIWRIMRAIFAAVAARVPSIMTCAYYRVASTRVFK